MDGQRRGVVVAHGLVDLLAGIAHGELSRRRHLSIEDVGNGIAAFLARIPCLDDGSTALSESRHHLCTSAEDDHHHGLAGLDERLYELLLATRQAQRRAIAVLAAEHDVLAHGSNDDVALPRLGECILPVGLLTGVDLAMQELVFPCALVAQLTILGFNLFRPVAAAAIDDVHVGGLALGHSLEELHDVRLFGGVVKLFPEIGHGGIAVVAAHRPDGVGVGACQQYRRMLS